MKKAYKIDTELHKFMVKTWTPLDNLLKDMKILFTYKD